jgi:hypothetical protein
MTGLRLLRIGAIAIALPLLFHLSQQVTAASGQGQVEGLEWALGALSLLFFVRALATEYSRGPEANLQKDLQWGVAIGGVVTILSRVWG